MNAPSRRATGEAARDAAGAGRSARLGRALGGALQALVLGALLALAVAHMILAGPGGSVFRYEGF